VHRYLHDEGERWVMWYHGRDTAFDEKQEGIIDIGTGESGTTDLHGPFTILSMFL
jgi:hypothetical protein